MKSTNTYVEHTWKHHKKQIRTPFLSLFATRSLVVPRPRLDGIQAQSIHREILHALHHGFSAIAETTRDPTIFFEQTWDFQFIKPYSLWSSKLNSCLGKLRQFSKTLGYIICNQHPSLMLKTSEKRSFPATSLCKTYHFCRSEIDLFWQCFPSPSRKDMTW